MTTLTLDGINKFYGSLHILKDINLAIGQGEFISLLGPSGCGKTTTLRCIAGFEGVGSGRILFGARDMTGVMPEHRDLGMVFQSYALFPHMTVAENLSFGLEVRKIPAPERAARIAQVLEMVKLADYGKRFPRELSGGQQQRVALARALVIEPQVLLLDEPLANLDAALRDDMRFFIRDLQQRVGITTIYVTHDQSEAMVMSDRIVVMNKGVIEQCGAPREIYERPASLMVADFIGQSNTIPGRIREGRGADYLIETADGALSATGVAGLSGDVRVMIRPEHIVTAAGENTLTGRVRKSIYQGEDCLLHVVLGSGANVTTTVSSDNPLSEGDAVTLGFPARKSWVLAA
ncbi:ABC transporter ATP-binding protein [Paracoccus aminophilus]|uniref:Spermidine/putrescine transport system, ATP-binding protein n=1 Tax=Paracoccus aminophilus JCM 7686 TaxID=1367847 RepID=S5XUD3_PARAH|nr:ABC transporter ATP-binding protein [Paracoccus aminophilus]AGT08817.1 spermidine/putrescine transport system, ATP-binding protein [Paracoccus aminophilus JCM 7686]